MADPSNVQFDPQNPNALFSPDQWSNQFSRFNNAALPWPSSYTGYPTNALGNFINPQAGSGIPNHAQWQAMQAAPPGGTAPGSPGQPPGTTINSPPAQPAGGGNISPGSQFGAGYGSWTNPTNPTGYTNQQLAASMPQTYQVRNGAGFGDQQLNNITQPATPLPQQAAPQQAPQQATAPSNSLTYPQVLALLANPGKVTTPGATVPIGPSVQPGAGVNNAFLQNAQGRPGMNQNFLSTLAAIQGRRGQ